MSNTIRTMDLPIATLFFNGPAILRTRPGSSVLAQFQSPQEFVDDIYGGTQAIITIPAAPSGQVLKSAIFRIGLNFDPYGQTGNGFSTLGTIDIHAVDTNAPFTEPELRIVSHLDSYIDSVDVLRPGQSQVHVPFPNHTTQVDLMKTPVGQYLKGTDPVSIIFHLHLVSRISVTVKSTGSNVFASGSVAAGLFYFGEVTMDYKAAHAQGA